MAIHLHRAMDKIKREILSLGALVEDRFRKSIQAVRTKDLDLANWIIDADYEVDEREIEVEEECLKILALYQPVATDLRLIVAVIKINNDLERIMREILPDASSPRPMTPASSSMITQPWRIRRSIC